MAGWWDFIPFIGPIIQAGQAIAGAAETAKGPFYAPTNDKEYRDCWGRRLSRKEIRQGVGYVSSAGNLEALNNKLTQVRSAVSQWESKLAGDTAHAEEVKIAGEDIDTQAAAGLKQLAASRASRGMRGAGEVMDPDVVFLKSIAGAKDRLARGENVYQIQKDLSDANIENQNAIFEGQQIKTDNANLLNALLGLGTQIGGEFRPGGMWGGPSAAETLLKNQNTLLLDYMGGKTTGTPDFKINAAGWNGPINAPAINNDYTTLNNLPGMPGAGMDLVYLNDYYKSLKKGSLF